MALRFNPPPNWPAPPEGFVPPAGWQPDPAWGPAPEGWELWVDDSASAASAPVAGSANDSAWAPTQAIPTGQSAPVASPTGQPASAPSGDYAAGNQYAGPQSGSAPVASSAASASPYAANMSYAQSPTPYHNQGQAGAGVPQQQGGWQPIDVNGGSGNGGKKPVTKQWWFWLIIGLVALLILIGIIAALAGGGDSSDDSKGSGVGTAAAADPTTGSGSSDSGSSDSSSSSSDEQGMSMDNPADPTTQTIKIKANEYASDPDASVEIQFGAVEWDTTDAIKKVYDDNKYSEGFKDPGSDKVYMRVPVTVTYHGKGQMNPYDITIDYVNKGNPVEASSDTYLLDDEFNDQDMPRDGGTVTGYFTYVIPKSDEKSGVFAVSGLSNYDQEMYMAAK